MESGITDYVNQVQSMPFYAAYDNGEPVGFAAIKVHNPFTSEIPVMGVLSEYHRRGIGRELIEHCVKYCEKNKMEFLTVKTLDSSRESKSYDKTRLFYQAMGFKPLEVFPLLWDENNPCLFLAMSIKQECFA
jgi:ribosomal protein S18 acetylase RimI-like enzyme